MSQENGPNSDKLQVLNVVSISYEECQRKIVTYIDGSHLCTISRTRDQGICNGDSGSPIVNTKNNELVGISSWTIQ